MKYLFFLSFYFIISITDCRSQSSKIDLIVGFGLPELGHLGVQYNLNQSNSIGIMAGYGFVNHTLAAVTLKHEYFIGKSKKFLEAKTWYLSDRLSYVYQEKSRISEVDIKYLFLTLSIGRNFNFSDQFGLSFDLGYPIKISEKFDLEEGTVARFVGAFPPSVRLQLFMKIL